MDKTIVPKMVRGVPLGMAHALTIFSVLLLTACDNSFDKENAELESLALKAVQDAKSLDDPWQAYQKLSNEFNVLETHRECTANWPPERRKCKGVPDGMVNRVQAELDRYKAAAVHRGVQAAIVAAYNDGKGEHLANLAPDILAAADHAQGTTKDRTTLRIAGLLVANGKATMLDTDRAIGYLSRAWAAGDSNAADDAAKHFLSINDYRNAYLWSLRCVDPCERSITVQLPELQSMLLPAAAKQAQRAANDVSVITLDTKE